ncbi:MAG TPA: STAS domain-containing protein [Solirubrobacteraceae bacterium]|jgi:anti-anti-sigma factor
MANAILEATTHSEGDAARIELRGDIDGSAREALGGAYADAAGARSVMLDFTQVDYINSTGIALIVGLLARARADECAISARGLSPHYREIFEITRLSDFMTIIADSEGDPA